MVFSGLWLILWPIRAFCVSFFFVFLSSVIRLNIGYNSHFVKCLTRLRLVRALDEIIPEGGYVRNVDFFTRHCEER